MRKSLSYLAVVLSLIFLTGDFALAASNLDEGVSQLAGQISKSMQDKQKQKIAIIDFSDLNGNVTALGQFMAEELTTQLFIIAPGKFEVVERRQLLKLEQELALGQMGFIEEKGIKKMGQVLGVDAIVTGSMTDLGNSVKINARLIGVDTAKVFAVAATDIPKTGMVADLIGKQAERKKANAEEGKSDTSPPAKPKAVARVEVYGFVFEVESCKLELSGKNVRCDVIIINKSDDRNIHLSSKQFSPSSRIIDESGIVYLADKVWLGKQETSFHGPFKLISGIPTKATFIFNEVSLVNRLALLEIVAAFGPPNDSLYLSRKEFVAQLRDIPLSR